MPADLMRYSGAPKVARLLTSARRTGIRLHGLANDIAPADVEQGYAVQAESRALIAAPVAGYKVGLTNERAQQGLGASAPISGWLGREEIAQNQLKLAVDPQHLAVVEAEIVFEIGHDLPPREEPFSEAEIHDSICGVFAGIEVCDSRFAQTDDLPLPFLVADNGFADRLVIGEQLKSWDRNQLDSMPVTLELSSRPSVLGSTANVLGNPLRSLFWLANWLASRGETLRAGQFVASGSCTGITQASHDDGVTATFGSGARASAIFVAQAGTGVDP